MADRQRRSSCSVNVTLEPGDHEVKVVMPNGVSDTMAFRT